VTPNRNIHFLLQGQDLIGSLDAETYAAPIDTRSSVGAHLRHVIDYYHCFLQGLADARIDYDARRRDPDIETDPEQGLAALKSLVERFKELDRNAGESPLEIKVDTRDDQGEVWSHSTIARELQFLITHTVHHYALIAMLLRQRDIDPGQAFGIAPSTLDYRRDLDSCVQ
jgi:uncharacterized damage-inducible protein DinB